MKDSKAEIEARSKVIASKSTYKSTRSKAIVRSRRSKVNSEQTDIKDKDSHRA